MASLREREESRFLISRRVPDCYKPRRLIGWEPKRSLADILVEIVEGKDT